MTELDSTILAMSMVVNEMQVEVDDWQNHLGDEPTDGMKVGYDWYYSTLDICKRALALLRGQKPRLYTVEEIEKAEDMVCWLEYFVDEDTTSLILLMKDEVTEKVNREYHPNVASDVVFSDVFGYSMGYNYRDYNKTWRCWTTKPIIEERREVPWDD